MVEAPLPEGVAVELDDAPAARAGVEVVHVLRGQAEAREAALQVDEGAVRRVRGGGAGRSSGSDGY